MNDSACKWKLIACTVLYLVSREDQVSSAPVAPVPIAAARIPTPQPLAAGGAPTIVHAASPSAASSSATRLVATPAEASAAPAAAAPELPIASIQQPSLSPSPLPRAGPGAGGPILAPPPLSSPPVPALRAAPAPERQISRSRHDSLASSTDPGMPNLIQY